MRITRSLVQSFLPKRPKRSHKGTFGRVLIVAGSAEMSGAAVLAARAALKTGAGMVLLALPKSRQCVAAAALPEMITFGLPERKGVIGVSACRLLGDIILRYRPDVLLVGPGLATTPFVGPFLQKNKIPCVLDADALNCLARLENWPQRFKGKFPLILTPHPGEMQRLIRQPVSAQLKTRIAYARQLAQRSGGIGVLKGYGSVVSNGKDFYVNTTGGSALAKAGTGDVLAGFIAGVWAQLGAGGNFDLHSALKAAVCGVYLHGACGDYAAEKLTDYCVLAGEVVEALPAVYKKLGKR